MTKTIGMPWYSREAYGDIRRAMADADRLPESYAYWLSSAESIETAVASGGVRVVRIHLELPAFLAWCEEQGTSANGAARSAWAARMVEASAGDAKSV